MGSVTPENERHSYSAGGHYTRNIIRAKGLVIISPAARPARSKGRPANPLVTRERIAQAALDLVVEHGYDRLTMAGVARRIGVAPSALYNHVDGKSALLAVLQDAVMGLVDVAPLHAAVRGELPVAEAVRAWARSYRDVFARHTPLIPVIATLPVAGAPATQAMYDAVAAALRTGGVPDEQIMPRVIACESFIYGSAFDVHAPAHVFETVPGDAELPAFAAASESFRAAASGSSSEGADAGGTEPPAAPNPYADAPFEQGLDLLLADL